MSYLCDTNVLSELARPSPNPAVVEWSRSVEAVSVSAVTLEEVYYGLAWKPNQRVSQWFDRFFADHCQVLPVTEQVARVAGNLRGRSQADGSPRTQADMLIAATAAVHGLVSSV